MPLDKDQPHRTVSGDTPDGCRFIQDDVRYKADGSPCKGQKIPEEPKVEEEPAAEEIPEEETED